MQRYLPSITSLRAFEAVARRQSFTRAALELNLTQTAISHQVRKLEEMLGIQLFVRDRNGTQLTDAGRQYIEAVRASLMMISSATERLIDQRNEERLSVICLAAFGLKCLMPLLPEFRLRHPEISLRLDTVVSFDAAAGYNYEVSIRYGDGIWPGMRADKIAPEELFPVASPALLARTPLLKPSDLANHTLIRTASLVFRDDWLDWLALAGGEHLEFADEITCDLMLPSVQAAIDGLGVVMGRRPLVNRELADGRLVEPFVVRLPSSTGYYLVTPADRPIRAHVQAFVDWLLECFEDEYCTIHSKKYDQSTR